MSIYKNFCQEEFDRNGYLKKIEFDFPDNFNFAYDVVDVIAKEDPTKTALVWFDGENQKNFSFKEISELSSQTAFALTNRGIKRGDKVMVILKRHFEYWTTAIALHKLGAVIIPATHMLTESDLEYRFKAADIKSVICTPFDEVPIKIAKAALGKNLTLFTVRKSVDGFYNLTDESKNQSKFFPRATTKATDPMLLYFTSGTTGEPKGVMHDFTYALSHIVTAKYWQKAEEGGLHFTVAETGWGKASWGKLYGQWLVGCSVMVFDFDNFDPKQLTDIINKFGVTSFCAPPTVYRYWVRKGIPAMPTLKHASTAGETLSTEVFEQFTSQTSLTLHAGYGQTETSLITADFVGETQGTLGKPSPMYTVKLLNEDGTETAKGEVGEIVIVPKNNKKPIGIFCGYLANEEQYNYVWRNGVYHTGDGAYKDEKGYLTFHGRFDDVIKTGGFRVGPFEIENVISKHKDVLECSVIGVPDALRGQAIKAFIVLKNGVSPSKEKEKGIKEFCNSRLAEYKWIRMIEFVPSLPKTISGKIRRAQLKQV